MDPRELFKKSSGFFKITKPDPSGISPSQKAALNRKGNQLFNAGQYEQAKKVFITTGYTDGLIRIGDYYFKHNEHLEALKMYWIAPAPDKKEMLMKKMTSVIQIWLNEKRKI